MESNVRSLGGLLSKRLELEWLCARGCAEWVASVRSACLAWGTLVLVDGSGRVIEREGSNNKSPDNHDATSIAISEPAVQVAAGDVYRWLEHPRRRRDTPHPPPKISACVPSGRATAVLKQ